MEKSTILHNYDGCGADQDPAPDSLWAPWVRLLALSIEWARLPSFFQPPDICPAGFPLPGTPFQASLALQVNSHISLLGIYYKMFSWGFFFGGGVRQRAIFCCCYCPLQEVLFFTYLLIHMEFMLFWREKSNVIFLTASTSFSPLISGTTFITYQTLTCLDLFLILSIH